MAGDTRDILLRLHAALAEKLLDLVVGVGDEPPLPLDAPTINAVSKFLKDNDILVAPESMGKLDEIREQLMKSSHRNSAQVQSILESADSISEYLN